MRRAVWRCLRGALTVRVENPVDKHLQCLIQLWLGPRRDSDDGGRKRTGDRLSHHPPVHAELGRNTRDRPDTKLMLLTKLLEQFHSADPIHSEPPGEGPRMTVG